MVSTLEGFKGSMIDSYKTNSYNCSRNLISIDFFIYGFKLYLVNYLESMRTH